MFRHPADVPAESVTVVDGSRSLPIGSVDRIPDVERSLGQGCSGINDKTRDYIVESV